MRLFQNVYISIIILAFPHICYGQTGTVYFIKAVPKRSICNTKDSVITYPIFSFKNKKLSQNLNQKLKSDFYSHYEQNESLPIRNVLKTLAENGLAEMSYEELRNDDLIFSFALYHEWIAAYPTYHKSFYAFDKHSSNYLTIDSLIVSEKRKAFKQLIINSWLDSLSAYKKDILNQLKNGEIDSTDYSLCLEYISGNCLESFSEKNFKLSRESLEVFFECPFPRILRPIDPSGGVSMSLISIKDYLRPKFKP